MKPQRVTSTSPVRRVAAALLLCVGLGACSLFGGDTDTQPVKLLFGDETKFDTLAADPATITDANVDGRILRLGVEFTGGCAEHRFDLYATGPIIETLPLQASVLLVHDGRGDTCNETVSKTLRFRLTPLIEDLKEHANLGDRLYLAIFEPGTTPADPATAVVEVNT